MPFQVVDGIVKSEKIPFSLQIQSLTRDKAKELVYRLVDFQIYLLQKNLVAMDVHESNLGVWNQKSYFIDLDAFAQAGQQFHPSSSDTCAAYAFITTAYLFVKYVQRNNSFQNHTESNITRLVALDSWYTRFLPHNFNDIKLWKQFAQYVSSFSVPPSQGGYWYNQYALESPETTPKILRAAAFLAPAYGGEMLDMGTNKGYFPYVLRDKFVNILGIDNDECCIKEAIAKYATDNVYFGVVDIQRYFNDRFLVIRSKADVVSLLAMTHHISDAGWTDKFIPVLISLAKKWILIEDISEIEKYNNALTEAGFERIQTIPSVPSPRTLSLWKRKSI